MTKFLKRVWLVLAFATISFAIVFSLFRGVTPLISQYRSDIEQRLSALLGDEVHIGAMETGWYWFDPIIRLKAVQLSHDSRELIDIGELFVGIDVFSSLWHWQLQPGILSIENLDTNLRQTPDGWRVEGISPTAEGMRLDDSKRVDWFMHWLLSQRRIHLEHASLRLHFLDGTLMPFTDVNLHAQNRNEEYTFKADAKMDQTTVTQFHLQGKLLIEDAQYRQAHGAIHLETSKFLAKQWQVLAPKSDYSICCGEGKGTFWIGIEAGKIKNGQAKIQMENLGIKNRKTGQQSLIQNLQTTANWQNTSERFQMNLSDLALRAEGTEWPENQVSLVYDKSQDAMQLAMRHLDLGALAHFQVWHPALKRLGMPSNLEGRLEYLKIRWSANQLEHFFARFRKAGWLSRNPWPSVKGLSGVLQLNPDQGHLRLDSEDVTITPQEQPPLELNAISGDIRWEYLQDAWDISIQDFNLRHPQLLLNTQGTIKQVNACHNPLINLNTHFLARDAEYWKPWLPREHLKPRLYEWLTQEVKHIPKLLGEVAVKGQWQDFPFDRNNGVFKIEALVEDAQITPLKGWPSAHAINGSIGLDGRSMDINVYHAWFGDVLTHALNLRIEKLGTDRETLILHTRMKDSAKGMIDYILQTPLKKRLHALSRIALDNPIVLDLQLDARLYADPKPLLLLGEATFLGNTVDVVLDGLQLPFKDVKGALQFDSHGLLDSQLNTELWHFPLDVRMRTLLQAKSALQIDARFPLRIDAARKHWPSNAWRWFSGSTEVLARMRLTGDPSVKDRLELSSDLKGLAIKLPPPFAKKARTRSKIKTSLRFSENRHFESETVWDKHAASHLWLAMQDGKLQVDKGEIRLGSTKASQQVQRGVQLLGHLPVFDAAPWQAVWNSSHSTGSTNGLFSKLDFVDLGFDKGQWFGQKLRNCAVGARKLQNNWDILIKEKTRRAQINWKPDSNALKVKLNRLELPLRQGKTGIVDGASFAPAQFPSLNVIAEHLISGDKDRGRLTLIGKAEKESWRLEKLQLENPDYALQAHGVWKKTASGSRSEIAVEGFMHDLRGFLRQMGYPELMQAKTGHLHFQGHWPGPLFAPVLDTVRGEGYFSLKNGVISQLSKAVEEKIGLGKILSIFSLQTIPRRLHLDFSDLSNRGYSFDKMKGNFALRKGLIITKNSTINGPVAHAAIKGNLNLLHKQCNLKLQITPHVTASLPVVATIAGGPIAGAVTWLVNKIVTHEMDRVRAYSYQLKGPWSHPVIEQGEIMRKRKA